MNRFTLFGNLLCVLLLSKGLSSAEFIRADPNQDGDLDISDPVATLGALFLGAELPNCADAMDSNDDGELDLSDGVYSLSFLFTGGPAPKPPFPECGEDPTEDGLSCQSHAACKPLVACFGQQELDRAVALASQGAGCFTELKQSLAFVTVTFCPLDLSGPCGANGSSGCAIEYSNMTGTLDSVSNELVLSLVMEISTFPMRIEETVFGETYNCAGFISLGGDLHVQFLTVPAENGLRKLSEVVKATLLNPTFLFAATGSEFCEALANCAVIDPNCDLSALFVKQLESDPKTFLLALGIDLEGQILCE